MCAGICLHLPADAHLKQQSLSTDSSPLKKGSSSNGVLDQHGMVLPFDPITITFRDLHYYVPTPEPQRVRDGPKELELLKGITGAFRPGVLTALMGVHRPSVTVALEWNAYL